MEIKFYGSRLWDVGTAAFLHRIAQQVIGESKNLTLGIQIIRRRTSGFSWILQMIFDESQEFKIECKSISLSMRLIFNYCSKENLDDELPEVFWKVLQKYKEIMETKHQKRLEELSEIVRERINFLCSKEFDLYEMEIVVGGLFRYEEDGNGWTEKLEYKPTIKWEAINWIITNEEDWEMWQGGGLGNMLMTIGDKYNEWVSNWEDWGILYIHSPFDELMYIGLHYTYEIWSTLRDIKEVRIPEGECVMIRNQNETQWHFGDAEIIRLHPPIVARKIGRQIYTIEAEGIELSW